MAKPVETKETAVTVRDILTLLAACEAEDLVLLDNGEPVMGCGPITYADQRLVVMATRTLPGATATALTASKLTAILRTCVAADLVMTDHGDPILAGDGRLACCFYEAGEFVCIQNQHAKGGSGFVLAKRAVLRVHFPDYA